MNVNQTHASMVEPVRIKWTNINVYVLMDFLVTSVKTSYIFARASPVIVETVFMTTDRLPLSVYVIQAMLLVNNLHYFMLRIWDEF